MKWDHAFIIKPYYKISTNKKIVALTFDDGPSAQRTLPLIDLLNKHNIHATFFMLGSNIERYPEIAKNVYKNGNLIGNHSYDHSKLVFKQQSYIRDQIERTDELIREIGQNEIRYFRPPYSAKYLVLPIIIRKMKKTLVTGTYDPPSEYKTPMIGKNVAIEIIDNVEPGSIIYLHDGKESDVNEFIDAIETVIIELKKKGYEFVRLDEENIEY
jgi:chitin deacetylase